VFTKVQEDNMEEIKRLNEIKAKCNLLIDHLGELWHMVNDENFRGILHYTAEKLRKKIQDANEQLKKYI
jgi:DNA-binding cell septation regulator SpoVG